MSQREGEHTVWYCLCCGRAENEEDLGAIEETWHCASCNETQWTLSPSNFDNLQADKNDSA